jgi:osmotically-inducible protein OsmY
VVDRSQDDRILSEVTSRIHAEPELSTRDIRIEVDAAIVRLYGGVAGMGEWRCALRNAQQVSGVLTVVDYLMIEPGPPTSRCLARPSSESIP